MARWSSGYGVGLATGDRGFNPSCCTVKCKLGQVVHILSSTLEVTTLWHYINQFKIKKLKLNPYKKAVSNCILRRPVLLVMLILCFSLLTQVHWRNTESETETCCCYSECRVSVDSPRPGVSCRRLFLHSRLPVDNHTLSSQPIQTVALVQHRWLATWNSMRVFSSFVQDPLYRWKGSEARNV